MPSSTLGFETNPQPSVLIPFSNRPVRGRHGRHGICALAVWLWLGKPHTRLPSHDVRRQRPLGSCVYIDAFFVGTCLYHSLLTKPFFFEVLTLKALSRSYSEPTKNMLWVVEGSYLEELPMNSEGPSEAPPVQLGVDGILPPQIPKPPFQQHQTHYTRALAPTLH